MVWGREGGKEGHVWTAVQAGEKWLPVTQADWNLKRTVLTNPQGLTPFGAACPWGPKEVQEGSKQEGFLLEPQDGFLHICSERENWRKRGALSYFLFPPLPDYRGQGQFLCLR